MKPSRLFRLLNLLDNRARKRFAQFLASPYFNQRMDVQQLFAQYVAASKSGTWDKVQSFAVLFPGEAYDDQRMRLLMSYLTKLLEQFIHTESIFPNRTQRKMSVAAFCYTHQAEELQLTQLRELARLQDRSAIRNSDYLFSRYQLEAETYRSAYNRQPAAGEDFQRLSTTFDTAMIAMKLRQHCLLLAHEQVYRWGYEPGLLGSWLAQQPLDALGEEPAIQLYYYCARMLSNPESEADFLTFKSLFLTHNKAFPPAEARDLILLAINFLVRRTNSSIGGNHRDILDLYQEGLDQAYLLRNGVLSRFTYHNIMISALHLGDTDWAAQFVSQWTDYLERRFRERMYNFSLAQIAYTRGDYDQALEGLQQSNYHDLLLNLSARTLLLKIYYEKGEWEVLYSHLDAFKHYLSRKGTLGYHRQNYRQLIRFVQRIIQLPPYEQAAVTSLQAQIETAPALVERDWLLKCLKKKSSAG